MLEQIYNWVNTHALEMAFYGTALYALMSEIVGAVPSIKENTVFQILFGVVARLAGKKGGESNANTNSSN